MNAFRDYLIENPLHSAMLGVLLGIFVLTIIGRRL
jgi:hypothetical protein